MVSANREPAYRWLGRRLKRAVLGDPDSRPREAYAQDGEDLILDRLLRGQVVGTFVDIGAHHPIRFSNTYLFYRRGWRGINVDAQPGSMRPFRQIRSEDTNIEVGVGSTPGSFPYFRFDEPALNTFDPIEAKLKDAKPYHLLEVVNVPVCRLDDILGESLPKGSAIDFLSVDVEGRDLDVLKSNDWGRFRPRFVLAETLRTDLLTLDKCPTVAFLGEVDYTPVCKAYNTTFFERSEGRA
jgi:FkbM family methyltransferase